MNLPEQPTGAGVYARRRRPRSWALRLGGCLGLGATTACGAPVPRPAGAAAVTVAAGALPSGPAASIDRLPIPDLELSWQPPSAVAGDVRALGDALRSATRIHIQLGARQDGELWRARVPAVLDALGATGTVAFLEGGSASAALVRPMPLRSIATGPADPAEFELAAPWRARMGEGAAAGTVVLMIDDAVLDTAKWRALPAASVGTCDAPMQALAVGQEQSLAELEPFLDHADALLGQLWRAELRALLPRLRSALEPHAAPRPRKDFADAAGWREHECGNALWQYTEPYHRCAEAAEACALSPRVLLVGGLRIGAPEPDVFVPDHCTEALGQDVVGKLREFGRDAAEAASTRLDARWVVLADRLGALTDVYAALEDVCAPRRRRFAPVDLDDARARLGAIGRALGSDEPPRDGRWTFEPDQFHVPGTGPVHALARYDAGPGSPARAAIEGARSLREFVLSRSLCRAGASALPLVVLAYEPSAGKLRYHGYLYEEELSCGELGPLAGA